MNNGQVQNECEQAGAGIYLLVWCSGGGVWVCGCVGGGQTLQREGKGGFVRLTLAHFDKRLFSRLSVVGVPVRMQDLGFPAVPWADALHNTQHRARTARAAARLSRQYRRHGRNSERNSERREGNAQSRRRGRHGRARSPRERIGRLTPCMLCGTCAWASPGESPASGRNSPATPGLPTPQRRRRTGTPLQLGRGNQAGGGARFTSP